MIYFTHWRRVKDEPQAIKGKADILGLHAVIGSALLEISEMFHIE
jgi:hypothetical protein